VSPASDLALVRWASGVDGGTLLLREGQMVDLGGTPATLLSLSAFTPAKEAPGQDRSHAEGAVGVKGQVQLTDGSKREVALRVLADGTVESLRMSTQSSGNFTFKTFSLPPAVGGPTGAAYRATASGRPARSDEGIFTDLANDPDPALEVSEGDDAAPGAAPALFGKLGEPVVNDSGKTAFFATLQGEGTTPKTNRGLWWGDADGLSLVARTGGFAPDRDGAATTAQFSKLELFGLPDGADAGPLFVAKLSGSDVSGANNRALHGVDSKGLLRELLRTGDELMIDGQPRKVKSFTVLAGGQPVGGRREFTTAGSVVARVVFIDRTTGLVRITIP
jgi:hypothetical protein